MCITHIVVRSTCSASANPRRRPSATFSSSRFLNECIRCRQRNIFCSKSICWSKKKKQKRTEKKQISRTQILRRRYGMTLAKYSGVRYVWNLIFDFESFRLNYFSTSSSSFSSYCVHSFRIESLSLSLTLWLAHGLRGFGECVRSWVIFGRINALSHDNFIDEFLCVAFVPYRQCDDSMQLSKEYIHSILSFSLFPLSAELLSCNHVNHAKFPTSFP